MKKFYIRVLGGNTHIVQRLSEFEANGKATERHDFKCVSRKGLVTKEDVWEVDVSVKDEIYRTRNSFGYQFIIYSGIEHDDFAREIFAWSSVTVPKEPSPFKHKVPQSRRKGVVKATSILRRPTLKLGRVLTRSRVST